MRMVAPRNVRRYIGGTPPGLLGTREHVMHSSSKPRLADRIERFGNMTASSNWNLEQDEAIPSEEWDAAHLFALRVMARGFPEPLPAPCGDGSVHLAWRGRSGARVVIERKRGETYYSLARHDGSFDEGQCGSDDEAIDLLRKHVD